MGPHYIVVCIRVLLQGTQITGTYFGSPKDAALLGVLGLWGFRGFWVLGLRVLAVKCTDQGPFPRHLLVGPSMEASRGSRNPNCPFVRPTSTRQNKHYYPQSW